MAQDRYVALYLYVVVSELQHPPRGLPHDRKRLLDDVVEALALGKPVAELLRLGPATNDPPVAIFKTNDRD